MGENANAKPVALVAQGGEVCRMAEHCNGQVPPTSIFFSSCSLHDATLLPPPLVSPGFPLKSPSSHPISSLTTKQSLKTLADRSSKRSPPSTTVKIAFHLVRLDTSPDEAPLGSRVYVVGVLLWGLIHSLWYVCLFSFQY